MRDAAKGRSYSAESDAFLGTLLDEAPGFGTLRAETHAVIESVYWRALLGPHRAEVRVEQIVSNTLMGDASGHQRLIRYIHTARRSTVVHELAHVATWQLLDRDHQSHGPEWRGLFVELCGVTYGAQYGYLLRKEMTAAKLAISDELVLGWVPDPIVDIDAVVGETRGGWLRK